MKKTTKLSSSFRDPSGFIYRSGDKLLRQVNKSYQENYELLMQAGLYDALTQRNLLVKHKVAKIKAAEKNAHATIEPDLVPFVSYPYEWSFSQLKDAALLTLRIQKLALKHDMSLKDASTYNTQFLGYKPIFIDTLSFEKYVEGKPWVAYRQFCQHFLAPLALMATKDIRLSQLLRVYIDGIPLDLTARLLDKKTLLNFGLLSHIHLHAKSQTRYAGKKIQKSNYKMSKDSLLALIGSLESTINKLKLKNTGTEWGDYYNFTNYSKKAFKDKKDIIQMYIKSVKPTSVWDLGANNGQFAQIAADMGIYSVGFDIDPIAIEKGYLKTKADKNEKILLLQMDLTNPSSNIGWAGQERDSLEERGPADLVMALALIHHLAIPNNLPFAKIAEYFARLGKNLIIEFVPKGDSQVQKLLATREDIFSDYTEGYFEKEFGKLFKIENVQKIRNSKRTIYLMTLKR